MESVSPSEVGPRQVQRRRRTLTGRAFGDLALWMAGLGLAMGLVFPFAIIVLGVPASVTMRVAFFVGTVAAGLIVGTANFCLAHRVVGGRLRELSARMRYVSERITESTYSGDWRGCTPATCSLVVDSHDELGDAAHSFNHLLLALARSRHIEEAMADFGASMSDYLELSAVASVALRGFVRHSAAQAGCIGVVRDGELVVEATNGIDRAVIEGSEDVRNALRNTTTTSIIIPDDLVIDTSLLSFRPRQVVAVPLHFKSAPVGVVVLAFADEAPPEVVRLLQTLANPCGIALNNALTNQRLQRLAAVDSLTGAYNRRFGERRLREEWSRSVRSSVPLGLISIDLDHFKAVNDTFGHLVGDRVLKAAVAATRLGLREGDDLVRTGGEEFLVVLPGAGRAEVEEIGRRVLVCVAAASVSAGHESVQVTASLGGVSWPEIDADGPHELLARLDEALYKSKRDGRNRLTMVSLPAIAASAPVVAGASL
jgi:diguanylate cyclase (GGDEF)-like protein